MTATRYYRGISFTDVYVAPFGLANQKAELRTLLPRTDIRGPGSVAVPFSWGSTDAGALELSLALLADALGRPREALALSIIFCDRVISRLPPHEPWIMSDNIVRALAASIAREPVPA